MPRYHTNSKEVLRDGKHFADCIDDGAARLIAEALNERKGMPVAETQNVLPLDGADGPLFVGSVTVTPKFAERLQDAAKEADLKLLTVAELEGLKWRAGLDSRTRSDHYTPPRQPHTVRQENDEYACSCGKRWDVADGEDHP